jgi:hypothetical protein
VSACHAEGRGFEPRRSRHSRVGIGSQMIGKILFFPDES